VTVSRAALKKIVLAFPGATEGTHHGRPSFHIGGKFFTWVRVE
jgi:hypothetical protein